MCKEVRVYIMFKGDWNSAIIAKVAKIQTEHIQGCLANPHDGNC